MLKGIPKIISPELIKILMEMGHGDEIVIGDANFPGQSLNDRCVFVNGNGVIELLEAILELMPLDHYEQNTYIIEKIPGDTVATPIWDEFDTIIAKHTDKKIERIERYSFYERTRKAYAVAMTTDSALYGCIILKKGVIA